jgi:pimeloyl-ACP methyl ester carboxylesterase
MPNVRANGIQIEYDTFGDRSSPALLLIFGLGGQMILWDEELCSQLANSGLYVIRFDNRDVGLSTKFAEAGVPNVIAAMTARMQGKTVPSPYSLDDMADDSVGLLDALGIHKAHICGMSMGGHITQTIAIRHPARVRSLVSIYSATGNPELPQPKPEVARTLLTPPPQDREGYIEHQMKLLRTISGPAFPPDEAWCREMTGLSYDRCFYPQGVARQYVAVVAHGDRRAALASVRAPALIVHGSDDPLVLVEGGKDTAKAIPGAELMIIEGMGHDIPHGGAWPRIMAAVAAHAKKADRR